mmetsp:Transcript_20387/g.47371  ORF Transcript_20387/g.47371 Transcript_20387/m.47371 type:complete len:291 (+) Transcript_20387:639-1511(+)
MPARCTLVKFRYSFSAHVLIIFRFDCFEKPLPLYRGSPSTYSARLLNWSSEVKNILSATGVGCMPSSSSSSFPTETSTVLSTEASVLPCSTTPRVGVASSASAPPPSLTPSPSPSPSPSFSFSFSPSSSHLSSSSSCAPQTISFTTRGFLPPLAFLFAFAFVLLFRSPPSSAPSTLSTASVASVALAVSSVACKLNGSKLNGSKLKASGSSSAPPTPSNPVTSGEGGMVGRGAGPSPSSNQSPSKKSTSRSVSTVPFEELSSPLLDFRPPYSLIFSSLFFISCFIGAASA